MLTDIRSDSHRNHLPVTEETSRKWKKYFPAYLYHRRCLIYTDECYFTRTLTYEKRGVYMSIELLIQLINLILLVFIAMIIWFGYKALRKYLKEK